MSTQDLDELNAKIEHLKVQLTKSKASLKQHKKLTSKSQKKKQQPLVRKKGFDTQKRKEKHKHSAGQKIKKKGKAVQKKKPKKAWKPPSIFAESEFTVGNEGEAVALKKKIFEHLSTHIKIQQKATSTSIEDMIQAERKKSENLNSVFLVNIGWVVDKYLQWKALMPRVMPFYAVKSNPDKNILRCLKMLGAGFDCASEAELAAVKQLGTPSENIIFANPCKGVTHIKYAKQCQVPMMTFDNLYEVDKIMSIYPNAKLVLRILPDDKYSLMPFGKKFGASWEESKELILKCKQEKADLIGVSFHVGSGCYDTVAYEKALVLAREVFDFAKTQGFHFSLLDLGGGYPGTDKEASLKFGEIAAGVTPVLDRLFPKESGIRIIAEPGRFFCSGSSTLAVVVNSKKRKQFVPPVQLDSPAGEEVEVHQEEEEYHDAEYHEDTLEDYPEDGEADEHEEDFQMIKHSQSAPELLELEHAHQDSNSIHLEELHQQLEDSQSQTEEDTECRNPRAVVSEEYEFMYYLSDGVYGSFNNIIFDHAHPEPVLLTTDKNDEAEHKRRLLLYKSRLFGPTCDSIDVICDCVELPELNIGDWLLFPHMGSYTVAAASSFNGFSPPNSTYIMAYDDQEAEEKKKDASKAKN